MKKRYQKANRQERSRLLDEREACTGLHRRSYLVMQDAFLVILERIPLPILELHPDNDTAFLNAHLVHFWQERIPALTLSRSRPSHKSRVHRKLERGVRIVPINERRSPYSSAFICVLFPMKSNDNRPPLDRLCETEVLSE